MVFISLVGPAENIDDVATPGEAEQQPGQQPPCPVPAGPAIWERPPTPRTPPAYPQRDNPPGARSPRSPRRPQTPNDQGARPVNRAAVRAVRGRRLFPCGSVVKVNF